MFIVAASRSVSQDDDRPGKLHSEKLCTYIWHDSDVLLDGDPCDFKSQLFPMPWQMGVKFLGITIQRKLASSTSGETWTLIVASIPAFLIFYRKRRKSKESHTAHGFLR